jgi:hypothetical protein
VENVQVSWTASPTALLRRRWGRLPRNLNTFLLFGRLKTVTKAAIDASAVDNPPLA